MGLILTSLLEVYERDLNTLKEELLKYENEDDLWEKAGNISNSAGNLALHITGNLQHFIGAVLGKTGYERNRENEFTAKNISRTLLISEIESTREIIGKTLNKLSAIDFQNKYPLEIGGKEVRTGFFLIHLAGHLNYHLGQINYHRRLI